MHELEKVVPHKAQAETIPERASDQNAEKRTEILIKKVYNSIEEGENIENITQLIKSFMKMGAIDLNQSSKFGTLLSLAIQNNKLPLVKFLVEEQGARIYDEALGDAIRSESDDIAKYLVTKGADVNQVIRYGGGYIDTPLTYLKQHGAKTTK